MKKIFDTLAYILITIGCIIVGVAVVIFVVMIVGIACAIPGAIVAEMRGEFTPPPYPGIPWFILYQGAIFWGILCSIIAPFVWAFKRVDKIQAEKLRRFRAACKEQK